MTYIKNKHTRMKKVVFGSAVINEVGYMAEVNSWFFTSSHLVALTASKCNLMASDDNTCSRIDITIIK
jgi:hypothetical protein